MSNINRNNNSSSVPPVVPSRNRNPNRTRRLTFANNTKPGAPNNTPPLPPTHWNDLKGQLDRVRPPKPFDAENARFFAESMAKDMSTERTQQEFQLFYKPKDLHVSDISALIDLVYRSDLHRIRKNRILDNLRYQRAITKMDIFPHQTNARVLPPPVPAAPPAPPAQPAAQPAQPAAPPAAPTQNLTYQFPLNNDQE